MHRSPLSLVLVASLGVLALTACGTRPQAPVAVANLSPAAGSQVKGTVRFVQDGDHVVVRTQVFGLAPNREHGFHVHEKGDCSAPDFTSAGGHFNPDAQPHGPQLAAHHAGDLPSLKSDSNGTATANVEIKGTLLGTGARDLIGKAVVVHADPDDYMSQPAGNSGKRIACGVIASPAVPGGLGGNAESKTIPKQM